MTSRPGFIRNDNFYVFFNRPSKYPNAINKCKSENGTLARHLDDAAYRNLSTYRNDGKQYWIGLSNRNQLTHKTNNCFVWVGSQNCANVDPLRNLTQPNSQRCQAVTVMWEKNQQPSIPQPTINNCTSKNHFICQYRTPTTASMTTTTSTTLPFKYEKTSSSSPNSTSSPFLTTSSSIASSSATGFIAALSITSLLLVFLMILLCYFCTRKGWWNATNFSKNHNFREVRENPIYDR